MTQAAPVLLWFRNDLRLADHAALQAALQTGRPVLPVYVLDEPAAGRWAPGGAARWWLHHSLAGLADALRQRGATLVLRRGPAAQEIPELIRQTGAAAVFTGSTAEPWARHRDKAIAEDLARRGVRLHRLRTTTLFHPDAPQTRAGTSFTVFTPFARACRDLPPPKPPDPAPDRIACPSPPRSDRLEDWHLLPTRPDWAGGLRDTWTPGEAAAQRRLAAFATHGLDSYADARDFPGKAGTSRLSPHLSFGELSAAQLWHAIVQLSPSRHRDGFLRELLWREFCHHLLWHHPGLPDQPLRPAFAAMPWREDQAALQAWQRGETGIPIIDAGMRQLWQTGWMHNRVRMIVASFLTKHLLLPWQAGEAWFWDTLVDADLANNAANWQWVAGCGADAAPYFRIFNPVLQGRKFDPAGNFVRQFVPQLARLDARVIHTPWEMAASVPETGHCYPSPIEDLAAGRARALAAYATIRNKQD